MSRVWVVLLSIMDFWSVKDAVGDSSTEYNSINMTENTAAENADTIGENKESGVDVNEILTDGFMDYFTPNLENIQERLGELT